MPFDHMFFPALTLHTCNHFRCARPPGHGIHSWCCRQAEKTAQFWKAQHAHMAKQVETLIRTSSPRSSMSSAVALSSTSTDQRRGSKEVKVRPVNFFPSSKTSSTTHVRIDEGSCNASGGEAGDATSGRPTASTAAAAAAAVTIVDDSVEVKKSVGGRGNGGSDGGTTSCGDGEQERGRSRTRGDGENYPTGAEAECKDSGMVSPMAGRWWRRVSADRASPLELGRRTEETDGRSSLTPPGTIEARRTIRSSKVPFEERRAVFVAAEISSTSGSSNNSRKVSAATVDGRASQESEEKSSPTFSQSSGSIGAPRSSMSSTEAALERVTVGRRGERVKTAAAAADACGGVGDPDGDRSPTGAHGTTETRVLGGDSGDICAKLRPEVYPSSPNSTEGRTASAMISPPREVSVVPPAPESIPPPDADYDYKSGANLARNPGSAALPSAASYPPRFVSPPPFRKPIAENRAKLDIVEAKPRTPKATDARSAAPPMLDVGGSDVGASSGGGGVFMGVEDRPEAQHSDTTMNSSSTMRISPNLRPGTGGGAPSDVATTQRRNEVKAGVNTMASLAMGSAPKSPPLYAPNPTTQSSVSSPVAFERLSPTVPAARLPSAPPSAASHQALRLQQGLTVSPSPVAAWIPNALQPSLSPRSRLEQADEVSIFGSPWSATALRQKALARKTSPPKRKQQQPNSKNTSLSPRVKDRRKKGSDIDGGRRRHHHRQSNSPASSRFASFWSQGGDASGSRNQRWGSSAGVGGHATKIWLRSSGGGGSRSGYHSGGSSGEWKEDGGSKRSLRRRVSSGSLRSSSTGNGNGNGHFEEVKEQLPPDHPTKLSFSRISAERAASLRQLRVKVESDRLLTAGRDANTNTRGTLKARPAHGDPAAGAPSEKSQSKGGEAAAAPAGGVLHSTYGSDRGARFKVAMPLTSYGHE